MRVSWVYVHSICKPRKFNLSSLSSSIKGVTWRLRIAQNWYIQKYLSENDSKGIGGCRSMSGAFSVCFIVFRYTVEFSGEFKVWKFQNCLIPANPPLSATLTAPGAAPSPNLMSFARSLPYLSRYRGVKILPFPFTRTLYRSITLYFGPRLPKMAKVAKIGCETVVGKVPRLSQDLTSISPNPK